MKYKLQILDSIQIFSALFLGMTSKIFETMDKGDMGTVFSIMNICALLLLVKAIFNLIEDKYGVKVISFRKHNNVTYEHQKALR